MSQATPDTELLGPDLLARLERLELVSRKIFRGRLKGERRSRRKGQSVEFADFRNYVPGDDIRFIDWNLYARLDKLFLKLFLEEEDLHFFALIDASQSMDFGEPTKLRFALQLAAALGYIGLIRTDRVSVQALGSSSVPRGPVLRGRRSLWRLLEYLNGVQPGQNVSLAEGVRNFCLTSSGTGILVLISDLLDKNGYQAALKRLLGRKMDLYVIHLLSPDELEPQLQGDLKLVDSEDADVAEVTANGPLLRQYRRTVTQFVDGARQFCRQRGINYLLADTRTPVDQLVANYLRKRGLVR